MINQKDTDVIMVLPSCQWTVADARKELAKIAEWCTETAALEEERGCIHVARKLKNLAVLCALKASGDMDIVR